METEERTRAVRDRGTLPSLTPDRARTVVTLALLQANGCTGLALGRPPQAHYTLASGQEVTVRPHVDVARGRLNVTLEMTPAHSSDLPELRRIREEVIAAVPEIAAAICSRR